MIIRFFNYGEPYEVEVHEFDVLTDKGLKADSIPEEEWTQGFRFTESEERSEENVEM